MATATSEALMPRVRWSWLWSPKADLRFNLLPFWVGIGIAGLLLFARNRGGTAENPVLNFAVIGHPIHLATWVMYLYGPVVDAPHLFATIARTYTDRDEWAVRRRLFLGSLVWFVIGPSVLLFPYVLRAVFHLPQGSERLGWLVWSNFFTFYALFHINRQHFGFVSLYKRKNGDMADPGENRVDSLFFYAAIWFPYAAMLTAPWYVDFDGKPFLGTQLPLFGTTAGALIHSLCHVAFFAACLSYAGFQIGRWRKGAARNGPKLVYLATILPLNYLAFAVHPLLAAFWVVLTGLGHCAQYHRVVWAYGTSRYAGKRGDDRRLAAPLFESVWLYAAVGLVFGIVTLQGPGRGIAERAVAAALNAGVFRTAFAFLDQRRGLELGLEIAAAFISGVRLHHFYVDSKIWRVSKSAALAKNLAV